MAGGGSALPQKPNRSNLGARNAARSSDGRPSSAIAIASDFRRHAHPDTWHDRELDGETLAVQSRDGQRVTIGLAPNLTVVGVAYNATPDLTRCRRAWSGAFCRRAPRPSMGRL